MSDIKNFKQMLAELGIDEMHDAYDDLWMNFLTGGRDINKIAEDVHQDYLAGKLHIDKTVPEVSHWYDQWYDMDGGE